MNKMKYKIDNLYKKRRFKLKKVKDRRPKVK